MCKILGPIGFCTFKAFHSNWMQLDVTQPQFVTTLLVHYMFHIDLARGMLEVPQGKIESLCNQITDALQSKALPARSLASIIGKLISMSIALGPVTRLMTKEL